MVINFFDWIFPRVMILGICYSFALALTFAVWYPMGWLKPWKGIDVEQNDIGAVEDVRLHVSNDAVARIYADAYVDGGHGTGEYPFHLDGAKLTADVKKLTDAGFSVQIYGSFKYYDVRQTITLPVDKSHFIAPMGFCWDYTAVDPAILTSPFQFQPETR